MVSTERFLWASSRTVMTSGWMPEKTLRQAEQVPQGFCPLWHSMAAAAYWAAAPRSPLPENSSAWDNVPRLAASRIRRAMRSLAKSMAPPPFFPAKMRNYYNISGIKREELFFLPLLGVRRGKIFQFPIDNFPCQ